MIFLEDSTGKYSQLITVILLLSLLVVILALFVPAFSKTEDNMINRLFFYYQDSDENTLSSQQRQLLLREIPLRVKQAFDQASNKDVCIGKFEKIEQAFFETYDLAFKTSNNNIHIRPITAGEMVTPQTVLLQGPQVVENEVNCIVVGDSAEELVRIINEMFSDGVTEDNKQRLKALNAIQTDQIIFRDERKGWFKLEFFYGNSIGKEEIRSNRIENNYFIKTDKGICLIPTQNNFFNLVQGIFRDSCRTNRGNNFQIVRYSCLDRLSSIILREQSLACNYNTNGGVLE